MAAISSLFSLSLPEVAVNRVVPDKEWATCIASSAPAEARTWLSLGKPGKIKDSGVATRSANLAFRLKATCARSLAAEQDVNEVAFDSKAVWGDLSRAVLPSTAVNVSDVRAASCTLSFILEDASSYVGKPEALPPEIAGQAAMQVGGYESLESGESMSRLTSTRQSDGKPVYLLRKCRLIAADGTLADA